MIQRDTYFEDRAETEIYQKALLDQEVPLPITKLGFEALLDRACTELDLPNNDNSLHQLMAYIHHLPIETCTTQIGTVGRVIRNAAAKAVAWRMDQEMKQRRNQELAELQAQLKKEAEEKEDSSHLSILPTPDVSKEPTTA